MATKHVDNIDGDDAEVAGLKPNPMYFAVGVGVRSHDQLIAERNEQYGGAWATTGRWISENSGEIAKTGSRAFALIMIHNKLTRALASPDNRDHYDDIIGYAKLILSTLPDETA